jgi:S-adenosylmethionine decarboxylase
MENNGSKVFGYQLLLDLYNVKPGVCDDLNYCYRFLDDSVAVLGMTKQSPPSIFVSPLEFPEKAGLSGWVPLIESHIAIHTLSPKNYISIDIYSCKEFDPKTVEEYVTKYFGAQVIDSQFIKRGFNYFSIVTDNEKD